MIRIRSNLSVFPVVLLRISQNSLAVNHCHIVEQPLMGAAFNLLNPPKSETFSAPPKFGFSVRLFSTSSSIRNLGVDTDAPAPGLDGASSDDDEDEEEEEEEDDGNHKNDDKNGTHFSQLHLKDDGLAQDVKTILDIIHEPGSGPSQIKHKLESCSVMASSELVVEVLSRVRNDWEAAFTFFLWAGKQPGYAHSVREYHSMIYVLGKMRKFDTAWSLIEEMRGGRTGPSLVTPQTLLIMIRRYCAVHDVGRAINTFYAHKRFNLQVGLEEFQGLLSALCRYKNVQDAEHLMFCNKNVFPFDTKCFNIILNGWCNLIVSTRQAERIWQEMSKRGIQYDVVSYASIISCYSKSSKLYKVFKLFDQMKKRNIIPDRKVYNAVIHALAKGRLVKEAVNLIRTMEENNVTPDVVTFNSLIKPLCKARKIDEAKEIFDEMLKRSLSPSIRTFHAFFRILRTKEEVFELLDKMRELGCHPTIETYIMLIRKFCRWRQLDDVFKIWNAMREGGISHDRSCYIVLIHGLFLNGKLEEAYKYYIEMQEKGFLPEPKTEQMLQAWVSGRQVTEGQVTTHLEHNQLEHDALAKKVKATPSKFDREKAFLRQPETRRVIRERGFSLWEQ
ncbi:pentatricopeptide repeat-containing protein At5g15010, mitochondrial-like [Gastrolobium bilobum]|uniref:pentatricopeptide repeat-containing protein At5g15010, mitochondrial-like n=1 Tax=Gastrolobium bilobum TaxID=150636 RepID=UPI002AB063CE|nr:pentatricopeptide repeat-containing protein At5g15010, mitochondrial-like [Gastrolobium bilobum]